MEEIDVQKQKQEPVITCGKCGEYQGTAAQVRGHRMQCKGPQSVESSIDETPQEPQPREREPEQRTERVPFGVPQKKMPNVPENDGYQYRVINDNWAKDPGRIVRAMKGGYAKVEGYEPFSVGTNDDGSSIKGVLMRIPKKFYDEDQKEKQKKPDRVDDLINRGKLEEQAGDNRYIPEAIRIHSNFNPNG